MDYIHEPQLTKGKAFYDHRGVFVPLSLTSHLTWHQSNISVNPKRLTLRGLHFQLPPYAQAKLIKVIDGSVLDFVVDIRKKSPNYMKLHIFEMEPGDELYVPREFAHGFITTKDNTIVQYLVDNDYNPNTEGSLLWSSFPEIKNETLRLDSTFDISNIIISQKDLVEKS